MQRHAQALTVLIVSGPIEVARAAAAATAESGGVTIAATLQAFLGLAIVLGLIVATAFFLKRLQPGRFGANSMLKPVASLALGTRERIVVVELGDKWLILGVTAQSITTLHTTDRGAVPESHAAPANSAFAPLLADWVSRMSAGRRPRQTAPAATSE